MCKRFGGKWECLSNVSHPDEVGLFHLAKVYRLDSDRCLGSSCRTMCKGNTRCLNGLINKEPDLASADNPGSATTSPSVPKCAGLRNYGSTCYLNAFLQIYFHFPELREAVYQLPFGENSCDVVGQLQMIFSQMQLSQTGLVDPGGLIEALHLSERDQQDAPEFHSLFMSLLETRFLSLGRTVIQQLFKGTCVYETRCQSCGFVSRRPSSFLELDIKVSSSCLNECIRKYLAEELLTGENQYACPKCCKKRDGSRCMRITETPLMLCFQLLRFTYDVRSGRRVKQKTAVRLPDMLDMGEFISNPASNSRRLYRCSGVLLHLGRQSTSGHYIAVIRCPTSLDGTPDSLTDSWKVCNDEQVFTIPASQFDLSKVNGINHAGQCAKPASRKDSNLSTPTKEDALAAGGSEDLGEAVTAALASQSHRRDFHVSSTAYMVFYRLVTDLEPKTADQVEVPDRLRKIVEASNSAFVMENEIKRLEQIKQSQLAQRREELRSQFLTYLRTTSIITATTPSSPPQPKEPDSPQKSPFSPPRKRRRVSSSRDATVAADAADDFCMVPTRWLVNWLKQPEKLPAQLVGPPKDPAALPRSLDAQLLLCPHGRVSPDNHLQYIRAVSRAGLIKCLDIVSAVQGFHSTPDVDGASQLPSPAAISALAPCLACLKSRVAANLFAAECIAINKELARWKRVSGGGVWPLTDAAIAFCSEAGAPPSDATGPTDSTAAAAPAPPTVYFVGAKSFAGWRTQAQVYFIATQTATAAAEATTVFNSDALCPHGCLLVNARPCPLRCVPPRLWHRLVGLFPNATIPTYSSDSLRLAPESIDLDEGCSQCVVVKDDLMARAQREREVLADVLASLASSHSSTTVAATSNTASGPAPMRRDLVSLVVSNPSGEPGVDDDKAVYLVPMDFISQWRRFVRNPTANIHLGYLPSGLEAENVLCEHSRLLMPWQELLNEEIVFPVSAGEWNVFCRAYSTTNDYPPFRLVLQADCVDGDVVGDAGGGEASFCPDLPPPYDHVCPECYPLVQERRFDFIGAQIYIRVVADPAEVLALETSSTDDTSAQVTSPKKGEVGCGVGGNTSPASPCTPSLVRRSTRTRTSRDDYVLRVDSSSRLQDIRLQMMRIIGAAPFDQHIALDGVELTDNSRTLLQLGIRPGSRLHLWVDAPAPDAVSEVMRGGSNGGSKKSASTASPSAASKPDQVETGFKGTRLVDTWSPGDSVSISSWSG
uniref:ubiquitinyl hydrolase 1 n=1 Tax=Mesocestoides corti TaxID=53468 RepID=A0A5K3FU94_MESCO